MISSIAVTGCYNIRMNSNKKIKINDTILSVEKDIPFVRYRLDTYGENEFNYIKSMMEQFKYSTHLIELKLDTETKNVLDYLEKNIKNVARFIYINITDVDVQNGVISNEVKDLLRETIQYQPDRIMIKDMSTSLDTVAAKKIIKNISKELGVQEDDIGVCSSPLSFGELACLTAVKARELMSIYSTIADVALPSANHQSMNCCGCIRYMLITSDTEAPADGKVKVQKTSDKESSDKAKSVKPKVKNSLQLIDMI